MATPCAEAEIFSSSFTSRAIQSSSCWMKFGFVLCLVGCISCLLWGTYWWIKSLKYNTHVTPAGTASNYLLSVFFIFFVFCFLVKTEQPIQCRGSWQAGSRVLCSWQMFLKGGLQPSSAKGWMWRGHLVAPNYWWWRGSSQTPLSYWLLLLLFLISISEELSSCAQRKGLGLFWGWGSKLWVVKSEVLSM